MLKAIIRIITVLAIANLLSIIGFVGWLVTSDRLDLPRVERIREIIVETRAEQAAREEEEADVAAAAVITAEEEARAALPPLTAEDKLLQKSELDELNAQQTSRAQRDLADMTASFERILTEIKDERALLASERDDFEQMRTEIAELEGSKQFKKSLAIYQSLPAAKAQALLATLIEGGEFEQAVAYLNAMQTRTAKKIVEKFEDPKLAAELLERLRTRGLQARAPEEP